ncbi:MAG: hypothetical protein BAJALOKI2v1_50020 [Promethearchaeota archaeon]|nr:MAG: hypothetical protein BAJALOKI2v1_50020 [Candidatus Lokiarchaeota archaeon]
MIINENYNNLSKGYELKCDECGSFEIDTINGEYVCKSCGLVLNIKKLDYNKPFKDDKIQNNIISSTKIGHKCERLKNGHSIQIQRLSKIHSAKNTNEVLNHRIRIEISRILNALNLPFSYREMIVKKVKAIRNSLTPGTKYRNPDKLIPIVVYMFMKFQKISINKEQLLEISRVNKRDFHAFLLTIQKFFPKYDEEKKKAYINQKIMEISEVFDLGMQFYFLSKKILYTFWDAIKCTKENVVAGLVSSIAVLCNYKDKVPISAICSQLNIQMSTIQAQVERRIFDALNIPGFQSLVKSADLLKDTMVKIGILNDNRFDENLNERTSSRK